MRNVLPVPGLAARDQVAPFQRRISARSCSDAVEPHDETQYQPVAHARAPGAACTSDTMALLPGLGAGIAVQADPFQRRISVRSSGAAVPHLAVQEKPAAQAPPSGAAATVRRPPAIPGVGLGIRDQAEPFQRRVSVPATADDPVQRAVQYQPTAQAVPPGPVLTDRRIALAGLELATRDQAEPFQRRISARSGASAGPQEDAQDTPTAQAVRPSPAVTA
ncbi:MAG TPA: hypothetical protein VF834_18065 [Streptosporangiaceae bacterium]